MAEDGEESRSKGEGAPRPCGSPLTELSDIRPQNVVHKAVRSSVSEVRVWGEV